MNVKKIILLIFFAISLFTSLLPQNVYLIVIFSILIWILLPLKKWWDSTSIAILFFSFFYAFISVARGVVPSGSLLLSYLISPVAFYRFGCYLYYEFPTNTHKLRLIIFIVLVYLINMFSLTFADISVTGIVNESRALLGHSIEDDALSATLYGLMSSIGIGCIGGIFSRNIPRGVRISFLMLVLLSLLTVIHLVNRTGIILVIIGIIAVLLFNAEFKLHKFIIYFSVSIILFAILYYSGLISEEVTAAYQSRETHDAYDMTTAGGRTEVWQMSLQYLFTCPIGWQHEYYSHNMWLDIARVGGWFSFIPFLIATGSFLKRLITLVKRRQSILTLLLFSLNLVILVAASVEPVIDGSISFFLLLLMFWGFSTCVSKE